MIRIKGMWEDIWEALVRTAENIYLQMKGMGFAVLLPVFGYLLLIPLGARVFDHVIGDPELNQWIKIEFCYRFLPFFSILWIYLFHHEYVEGEGREILLLGRGVAGYTFFYFLLNLPFLWCGLRLVRFSGGLRQELFDSMLVCCFFFCGLVYLLNFSFRKIALSFLLVLLYIFLANIDAGNTTLVQIEKQPPFFYTAMKENRDLFLVYGCLGLVCWLTGWYRSKQI